jgi:hypothetical protein
MRAGSGGPGRGGPCPGGARTEAPGGPGGVFRTPGPRFAGLAGGWTRRICRLIVVLPAGNAAKTSQQPRLPGYGEQPAPAGWRGRPGQQPTLAAISHGLPVVPV